MKFGLYFMQMFDELFYGVFVGDIDYVFDILLLFYKCWDFVGDIL